MALNESGSFGFSKKLKMSFTRAAPFYLGGAQTPAQLVQTLRATVQARGQLRAHDVFIRRLIEAAAVAIPDVVQVGALFGVVVGVGAAGDRAVAVVRRLTHRHAGLVADHL